MVQAGGVSPARPAGGQRPSGYEVEAPAGLRKRRSPGLPEAKDHPAIRWKPLRSYGSDGLQARRAFHLVARSVYGRAVLFQMDVSGKQFKETNRQGIPASSSQDSSSVRLFSFQPPAGCHAACEGRSRCRVFRRVRRVCSAGSTPGPGRPLPRSSGNRRRPPGPCGSALSPCPRRQRRPGTMP